jgi:hypothetical protein
VIGGRWLAGLLAVATITPVLSGATETSCAHDALLSPLLRQLIADQNSDVAQTLQRIEGTGRRLLALRSYLRTRDSLAARWSWSQAQIDAYLESDEYRDLLAEIHKICAKFEVANPGFELYANTEVRSLDQQIERWNSNTTVGRIASDLERDACDSTNAGSPAEQPNALRDFLTRWQPELPPPLAAPGLSLHGRGRAIDFQVHQGNRVIAGPETAEIASTWIAQGWSQKLNDAVRAGSTKFEGPLKMPNEPWHYEYRSQTSAD